MILDFFACVDGRIEERMSLSHVLLLFLLRFFCELLTEFSLL